jgi:hypothetical protein
MSRFFDLSFHKGFVKKIKDDPESALLIASELRDIANGMAKMAKDAQLNNESKRLAVELKAQWSNEKLIEFCELQRQRLKESQPNNMELEK